MTIQKCLFNALLTRCEADINDCVARLTIYFNNAVGIGEHPQITEEMTKMLEELSSAEDRKAALLNHFSHYQNPEGSKCPVSADNSEVNCCCDTSETNNDEVAQTC